MNWSHSLKDGKVKKRGVLITFFMWKGCFWYKCRWKCMWKCI